MWILLDYLGGLTALGIGIREIYKEKGKTPEDQPLASGICPFQEQC